jgi:hypothetical protein
MNLKGGTFIWIDNKYKGLNKSGKYDSIWMNYLNRIIYLGEPRVLDNNKPRLWSKWISGRINFPYNISINNAINKLDKKQLKSLNKKILDSINQRENDLKIGKKYDQHKYVLDNLKYILLYNNTKLKNKMKPIKWKQNKKHSKRKRKNKNRKSKRRNFKLVKNKNRNRTRTR